MKRSTEITFETEEIVAVKARHSFNGFCGECNAFVAMVPVEAAAILTGLGEREIFRLIESGEIHFLEAERVFVCLDSPVIRTKTLPAATGSGEGLVVESPSSDQITEQTKQG